MLKVVVIGSGNVARHLIRAFAGSPSVEVAGTFARHPEKLSDLLTADKITSSYSNLAEADTYIIAVSDDAVADVSSQLPFSGRLVVHTSGSVTMDQPDGKNRRGVFYPLQTFSKSRPVDFTTVPFCLEAEHETDYPVLEQLASALSPLHYRIDSAQRQALHVAAVFASNFANHMYTIGSSLCESNGVPFDILKPLIAETAAKVQELPPLQAQTGPAVRRDSKTVEKHLAFLNDANQKNIYQVLTQSIQQADVQKL